MGNRQVKRYSIAVLLALGATLLAFGVAYGAVAQWTRTQGVTVNIAQAQVMAPESMKLCEDEGCLNVLTSDERIPLTVTLFKPPLDRFISGSAFRWIWAQNDSDFPLTVVHTYGSITDPATGEFLGSWDVNSDCVSSGGSFYCPSTPQPVEPGEIKKILVRVYSVQPAAAVKGTLETSIVIAAIGETEGATGSAVIQGILEQLEAERESQQEGPDN